VRPGGGRAEVWGCQERVVKAAGARLAQSGACVLGRGGGVSA
jgi:hypothetical protein